MAKTYADIQKEIESLQKAAESLRQKEVSGVIERIKLAIKTYQLSAHDLGFGGRAASAGPVARRGRAPKAAKAGAGKYRNDNGQTWSGRGRRPGWVNAALAAGKTLADLRA